MSDETTQARHALIQLLGVCKSYQAKALAQDAVLKMMLELAPADRAAWSLQKVEEATAMARRQIEPSIDLEAAALEQALSNDSDFQLVLRTYLLAASARADL